MHDLTSLKPLLEASHSPSLQSLLALLQSVDEQDCPRADEIVRAASDLELQWLKLLDLLP